MKKMNPVIHFEMPSKDKKRVAKFYKQAFGWGMQILGPEMNHYIIATTTDTDKKGFPKKLGAINGGFFQRDDSKPDMYPSVVIAVDDIKAAMKKVKEAGGEILGEPVDISTVGMYVSFRDTEGNRVSLLQPSM